MTVGLDTEILNRAPDISMTVGHPGCERQIAWPAARRVDTSLLSVLGLPLQRATTYAARSQPPPKEIIMSVYMVERSLKGIAMSDLAAAQQAAIATSQRFSADTLGRGSRKSQIANHPPTPAYSSSVFRSNPIRT